MPLTPQNKKYHVRNRSGTRRCQPLWNRRERTSREPKVGNPSAHPTALSAEYPTTLHCLSAQHLRSKQPSAQSKQTCAPNSGSSGGDQGTMLWTVFTFRPSGERGSHGPPVATHPFLPLLCLPVVDSSEFWRFVAFLYTSWKKFRMPKKTFAAKFASSMPKKSFVVQMGYRATQPVPVERQLLSTCLGEATQRTFKQSLLSVLQAVLTTSPPTTAPRLQIYLSKKTAQSVSFTWVRQRPSLARALQSANSCLVQRNVAPTIPRAW